MMHYQNKILVVDDDSEISDLLARYLTKYSYEVLTAKDGEQMFRVLNRNEIDLILLDIMLPGENGITLCQKIRVTSAIPIIMLTAVDDETEKVVGLEAGADDYQTKPFRPRELLARIKAVMRRYKGNLTGEIEQHKTYLFADWQLDTANRKFLSPDQLEIGLSAGEYDLLLAFLERPQRILSRERLLGVTRNRSLDPFDRSIDVQISRLRQKIEEDPKNPQIIKTVRGGGYMLTTNVLLK